MYREAVPIPVRCELQQIDVERASDSELEQHINDEVACLMRVWGPTVKSAGFTMYRPTVTVYERRITTKCGEAKDKNAFYCGGDQQIYYAQNLYASLPEEDQGKRWSVEAIIAHEFGHAVQGRTGILAATHGLQSVGGTSKSDQNQLNRQLELQADCFAGVFLQSVSQSMQMTSEEKSMLSHMFFDMGDDVLSGESGIDAGHGSGVNRQYWMNQGYSAKTLAQCNTFTAAPDQTR